MSEIHVDKGIAPLNPQEWIKKSETRKRQKAHANVHPSTTASKTCHGVSRVVTTTGTLTPVDWTPAAESAGPRKCGNVVWDLEGD